MSASRPRRRLEDHLCFAIYTAHHAFSAAYKPLLEPLGLTYPQYLVLLALWEKDGMVVSEIGRRLHLDSGTLTPLLKRMEKGALVSRQRNPSDERRVQVHLTQAGRALQAQAERIFDELECALGGTGEERSAIRASVAALTPRLRLAAGAAPKSE